MDFFDDTLASSEPFDPITLKGDRIEPFFAELELLRCLVWEVE